MVKVPKILESSVNPSWSSSTFLRVGLRNDERMQIKEIREHQFVLEKGKLIDILEINPSGRSRTNGKKKVGVIVILVPGGKAIRRRKL